MPTIANPTAFGTFWNIFGSASRHLSPQAPAYSAWTRFGLSTAGFKAMVTLSDIAGYLASTMVLLTFLTKDMRLLRVLAIFSNIAFVTYGMLVWLPPVFCLHLLLLPVNAHRLREMLTTQSSRLPVARPRPSDGRWRSSLRSMSARLNRGTGTAWRFLQPDALHVGLAAVPALNHSRKTRGEKR